jgi:hypothetical protein
MCCRYQSTAARKNNVVQLRSGESPIELPSEIGARAVDRAIAIRVNRRK